MKICNKCNHQASDDAKFCPVCGNSFEEKINENQNNSTDTSSSNYSYYNFDAMSTPPVQESEDKSSVGFGILCFFFPITAVIFGWFSSRAFRLLDCYLCLEKPLQDVSARFCQPL